MEVVNVRCAGLDVHKKVIVACGRITVPGWMVALIAPDSAHPDRSTASVAEGLYSSTNSAPSPATGECCTSLKTISGAAL